MKYVVVVEQRGIYQAVGPYATMAHARQHATAWHGDDDRKCTIMPITTTYSYVVEHANGFATRGAARRAGAAPASPPPEPPEPPAAA
jgi:hypothetical protein